MLHASIWSVALRWSVRGIGLASTVILARLLIPADFGIVAMAMLFVGAIEILSETGQRLALIRHPAPAREHYDTAWTVSILIGLCLSAVIFLTAPIAGWYFHEPRAVLVVECLAVRALLGGFENIGVVDFRKELQFSRQFGYAVYQKLISFAVTVALALLLRNYWALVGGIIVSRIAEVGLSFAMHPYRPRLSLAKTRELWSFSTWLLVKHVGEYLTEKLDEFFVGRATGTVGMGRYNVAEDLAGAPTSEIAGPIVASLFPVMAKVQGDRAKLVELYLNTLGWMAVVCASTSVGVAVTAHEIVAIVLGSRWLDVTPLIEWLALAAGVTALTGSCFVVLEIANRPQFSARLQWSRVALLLLILPIVSLTMDPRIFAIARFAVSVAIAPFLFLAVSRVMDIPLTAIGARLWRPLAAAALMAGCVHMTANLFLLPAAVQLAILVLVGGVSFCAFLLLLWLVTGRPQGTERDLLSWLAASFARISASEKGDPGTTHR